MTPRSRYKRALSDIEREFLTYVLSHGNESARSFLGQLPYSTVVSHCDCGCPTISLEIDRCAAPGVATSRIIVDLLGLTPDQKSVGILVFADNGYLSELEIYDLDELSRPYPLPTIESLHDFESHSTKTD